jgi:hypothetical protein
MVALSELVRAAEITADKSIYHKNLLPVTYVTGDVAGAMESPVYAILKLGPQMDKFQAPGGYAIEQHMAALPTDSEHYSMKWDGEWHITYEVFRDLGIAFAAVLVLIYGLVVGWFQSFITPLVIMAAIPFSLVGILPAHGMLHAFFTATSMIGFIAGAGIVVRNSIILVDFIELRLKEGMPLDEAVIDAGAVRFRPMVLTAAAVVVGAGVILFDPIFQGLAIALMAGEVASLALSRMTVPIVYFVVNRRRKASCPSNVVLGESGVVFVHGFRRLEPVPIGVYQLVPDDDIPAEAGCGVRGITGTQRRQPAEVRHWNHEPPAARALRTIRRRSAGSLGNRIHLGATAAGSGPAGDPARQAPSDAGLHNARSRRRVLDSLGASRTNRAGQLLGDVVRSVPRGNSRSGQTGEKRARAGYRGHRHGRRRQRAGPAVCKGGRLAVCGAASGRSLSARGCHRRPAHLVSGG